MYNFNEIPIENTNTFMKNIKNFFSRTFYGNKISCLETQDFDFLNIKVRYKNYIYTFQARTTCELYMLFKLQYLENMTPTYTMTPDRMYDRGNWTLFYKNKPLSKKNIALKEYGLMNNSVVEIKNYYGLGGSKEEILLPTYTIIKECEHQVLKILENTRKFKLQSENSNMGFFDVFPKSSQNYIAINDLQRRFELMIGSMQDNCINNKIKKNTITRLVSDLFIVLAWHKKCKTANDYINLLLLAYRLFVGQTCYETVVEHFFGTHPHNLQADFSESVDNLRMIFENVKGAANSTLAQKFSDMYAYLIAQGFLRFMNVSITPKEFSLLGKHYVKKDYLSQMGLVAHAIDLALFLCERFNIYKATGDPKCFVHSTGSYQKWYDESDRILGLAPFTSNLEAHGTTYFSFLSDLNDVIEKGEAICKYSLKNNSMETTSLKKRLSSLILIKNTEVTKRASQKERKSPFGVLVHGSSSVAKSSFTKMLFYYYGSIHGLDKDDHYRYVRNPADEYWSNFDSSKWCIQLDDIAFLLPSSASDVDATLKELLNVVNNVPYVPPQAALEDKGKTPVMAKLVIGTTNAKDLNAHEYFHCPLAVRRRLPYIIHVEPKQEYLHENGKFIDPAKLPTNNVGYPDFWNITVQKLVPVTNGNRDWAILEDVQTFSDVKEFLKHYGKSSFEHDVNQDKSMVCDNYMKDISVCPLCFNATTHCDCQLQASWAQNCVLHVLEKLIDCVWWFMSLHYIKMILIKLWAYQIFRYITILCGNRFLSARRQLEILAEINTVRMSPWKQRMLAALLLSGTALMTYYCYQRSSNSLADNVEEKDKVETEEKTLTPQGNMYSTTELQLEKEETQNVWYTPNIELTNFDMPLSSTSLVGKDIYQLRDLFQKNCIRLDIKCLESGRSCRTGGVMLVGQICLFNNHVLKNDKNFIVTVIQSNPTVGLNSNIEFRISMNDMIHSKKDDLSVMIIKSLPPYKDILKFWVDNDIIVSRLCMLKRQNDATMRVLDVHGVVKQNNFPIEALNINVEMLMGMAQEATQPGDCGSLAIAMTPRGPVLCGLHTVGYNNTLGVPYIKKDVLDTMIEALTPTKFIVQGCGAPVLGLQDEIKLITPHHKSLIRYIEHGNANVYGAFPGFRPKPKSRVCKTPLSDQFCEYFDTTIKFGKPVMGGWEPWRKNVIEMVKPVVKHDRKLLKHCVEAFSNDIITKLDSEWEKELLFLSKKASLNGLPGVKFIDKMNVSTSMGFPWNKTKKAFLIPAVDEIYPEGVDFEPAVWERYDAILEKYARGERAFPIFTGHMKDEARPLKKCLEKNTRLFTGGPADWSLVVRSRLLTFVRLLQKNKYIFEAGPGLVTQSVEWTKVREYLTSFGDDQIIAGDYGKFDKHMISDFILAAFEIICNVYQAAGFSEDEIREIYCIGNDIAFPCVNVSGDLMEFFGTNPSGHPLTVVINSLVNSLYIRYAYGKLGGNLCEFQDKVHLFTYGDDNAMGVSKTIPWFNHTAIQNVLHDIGVTYTMADKEAESVPYININNCSFLKRTWRYDEDVGAYLAPLDEDSIHRSLTMWVPSGSINEFEQMIAVITSANNEYFFYGKEIFNKHRKFFCEILNQMPFKAYITDSTLPTWQDLYERFWRASGQPEPTCI